MTAIGYRGYGLRLRSDLELPEFETDAGISDPDIRIVLAPEAAAQWRSSGDTMWQEGAFHPAPDGGFVLRVPDVAVYHVRGGTEIRIAPYAAADPGMVRLFTIGSAMGMAMHQRGVLVLHGATVARDGRARILIGDSGTGKSTLAARLGQAGCAVLGDDTMALWPAPGGGQGRWLWQGSKVFKLWQDSIEAMGMPLDGLARLGNRANKFYVPNRGQADAGGEPTGPSGVELAEILVLEEGEGAPRIESLTGLAALEVIAAHTYRPEYVPLLGREEAHFRQCGELTRDVPVGVLFRPWGVDAFGSTLALLTDRWTGRAAAGGCR